MYMTKEEYSKYLKSEHWIETREKRIEIDNHRCYVCGKKSNLNVHHIQYRNLGHEDINNDLVTLCKQCHLMLHKIRYGTKKEHDTLIEARKECKGSGKEKKAYMLFKKRMKEQFIEQFWIRDVHFGGDVRVFDNGVRGINKILKMVNIIYPDVKNINIEDDIRSKIRNIRFMDESKSKKGKRIVVEERRMEVKHEICRTEKNDIRTRQRNNRRERQESRNGYLCKNDKLSSD